MSKISYYEILEVSPNASQAVIRAAYKSLIQSYHPDKNSGSLGMEQQTVIIREAFEVLSDPQKRTEYDESLRQQKSSASENNTHPVPAAQTSQLNNSQSSDVAVGWSIPIIILIVFILGILMSGSPSQNHELTQVEPENETEQMRVSAELAKENELADERKKEESKTARTILKLATNIKVKMFPNKYGSNFCGEYSICTHYISIPTLGVVVRESDSEKIIQHIQKNQGILIEGVKKQLGELPYTDFTQVNGEEVLKRIILEQMNQTIVGYENIGLYHISQYKGVEEVLLPDSFSLH